MLLSIWIDVIIARCVIVQAGDAIVIKKGAVVFGSLRLVVFGVPMGILLATVVASIVDLNSLLATTSGINSWVLVHFSGLFSWGTFLFVLTCAWAFLSPLGRVKIGGKDAVPLLSKWNWFSITLCTTIAIGILFWATAEPIFHISAPPEARGLVPGSPEAAEFAMTSLFMHWSITPYAIYTVPGLTFALVYHNLNKPFSLSGPLSLVLGKRLLGDRHGMASQIIDAIALFALVAGIAATLGAGMLSISAGISKVTGLANTPYLMAAVTVSIVGAFVVSSVTGLHKGIRLLSSINTRFFFLLLAFVFVTGPSLYMLSIGWEGLQQYIQEFLPRSLGVGAQHDEAWAQSWTVFYWANWLAWAPITALFLGRIARGYTVRQFILVNLIAPSLFALVWMSIFGGAALHIDTNGGGVLSAALKANGAESIAYDVLAQYPLSCLLMVSFILLSFISYVTAADSNTSAIASVCLKDANATELKNKDSEREGRTNTQLKVLIAIFIGAAAWVMTAFSGIDGVKMMSNLGGLPALVLVLLMNVALILLGTRYLGRLNDT